MRRHLASLVVFGLTVGRAVVGSPPDEPAASLPIVVSAAKHDSRETPVRLALPPASFRSSVREALKQGPVALALTEGTNRIVAQAELRSGTVVVTWIQPGKLDAGTERRLTLAVDRVEPTAIPWSFKRDKSGAIDLARGVRPVFRYNAGPVLPSGLPEIQRRDAYLHPVYTPSGVVATGDFSKFHTHHRGIFLAYAKMKVKGEVVDVWNIHSPNIGGKIHHESLETPVVGPVTARFSATHRWETRKQVPFLHERWDVEVYDVPNQPYWLFDVTSTQTAIDTPVELTPYRYGGMAYRGPEPFVKGKLDVLTSEGRGRVDGDQKPTKWVDLTGPISDGSTIYAGAMIADHPGNVNHPTVARIHPTSLPFFSYVPAHEKHQKKPVILEPGKSLTFRYRVLVHDGRPDGKLDEQVWADFADPARASLATKP